MLNRIVSRLDSLEQDILEKKNYIKSKKHNVIDAIGVGLYKLSRI